MEKKLDELDLKKSNVLAKPDDRTQKEIWENIDRLADRLLDLHRAGIEEKKNETK